MNVTAILFLVRRRLGGPPIGEIGKEITWKT
jgi:hypothetical protein